jgi:hypothetical protein
MEIKVDVDAKKLYSLPELVRMFLSVSLEIEHFKFYYEEAKKLLSPRTIREVHVICPKLEGAGIKEPNDEQMAVLKSTFSLQAIRAIAEVSDKKATVTTETALPHILMASQVDRCEVEFSGGQVPTYLIREKDSKEFAKKINVIAGVPSYNSKVCETFVHLGFKTSLPAHSKVVNLASTLAVTHHFGLDRACLPVQFVPAGHLVAGTTKGALTTALATFCQDVFTHLPCSAAVTVADVSKQSDTILKLLDRDDIKHKVLGLPMDTVLAQPRLGGREFKDLTMDQLSKYSKEILGQFSRSRNLVKDFDTGYSAMNAPLKWRLPLEAVTGNPDSPGFARNFTCCYYGAAGSRARRVVERRAKVSAYDLKTSPAPTKKITVDDFSRLQIYQWKIKDVFSQLKTTEDIFLSDIYMPMWKVDQSPDPGGHHFVSGVIRGVLVNGETDVAPIASRYRLVKGFVPSTLEVPKYDSCYPFFAFRVSRPLTHEIIYLKTNGDDERISKNLEAMAMEIPSLSSRSMYVATRQHFELFLKSFLVSVCEEASYQVRRPTGDPRIITSSPNNRDWGLASKDMPCLFVPKGMRVSALNAIEVNSSCFGTVVMGETLGDDLTAEFHTEASEIAKMNEDLVQAVVGDKSGGVKVTVNLDD